DAPSGSEPRVLVPEAERLPPPDGAVANGPPFAWQHATNVRPVSKPGELILFDLDAGLPSVRFLGDMERYPFIEVDYHSRLTTNKRALIEKRAGLPNYPPQLQLSGPSR